jgi:hypothetical protein
MRLREFERSSVLGGAAALALWPPNSDRRVALRGLVDSLAAGEATAAEAEPAIDAPGWRRWLESEDGKAIREIQPDGIHDAPLTIDTALLGQRRALLAGDLEFPDLHYRLWMEAVAAQLAAAPDPGLRSSLDLLEAVSRLSDRVIRGGQIGGYRWPDHSPGRRLSVPDDAEFERLRGALTLSRAQLESELELDPAVLDALLRGARTEATWRPLAPTPDGGLLVADPWRLTLAGLVRACASVAASPRLPALLERLTATALEVAVEAAEDMDWEVELVDENSVLARADADCRVLVSVCVLAPGAEAEPDPERHLPDSLAEAHDRLASRARELGVQHSLLAVLGDGRAVNVPADHPCLHAEDPHAPWILGLPQLQLIGDALRRDPLALPSALEKAPRPPWPGNLDLVDWVGFARQIEEPPQNRPDPPADGTEYLWLRARLMAARHPAPRPDGGGWSQAGRWGGAADRAMFQMRGQRSFGLLVRFPGRSIWVVCADRATGAHDLDGVVCRVLAYWSARLCERDWPRLPAPLWTADLLLCLQVEVAEEPGPSLAIGRGDDRLRLIVGPGFVHELCRGDNDADRMLVAALLDAVGDRPPDAQRQLLDELLPAGRGTIVIWPDPRTRSNPPRLPPLPLVASRDRSAVEAQLAGLRAQPGQILTITGEALRPALEGVIAALERLTSDRVAGLDPSCLRDLVALHERALVESAQEAVMLPARDALPDADHELGSREPSDDRDLALRHLIERVSARPPAGSRPLGRREAGWLRAAAELGLRLGAFHEALAGDHTDGRLTIGELIGVSISVEGALPAAGERMVAQMSESAPDLMAREHEEWWTDEPRLPEPLTMDLPIELGDPDWRRLDRAALEEWGVGVEQLTRLLRALSDLADAQADAVTSGRREALVAELCRITAIEPSLVACAVDHLTLGECPDYEVLDRAHSPWGSNRDRSYLRRPLVRLPDGELAWSALHALNSARYLHGLIQGGRLRGGPHLRRAVGRVSQNLDREFEEVVEARTRELGWEAELRVERIGGLALERRRGEEIGNIDVLAWSAECRQIWLLEAKRWAQGLVPSAMVREGESLAESAEPHRERLEWVRAHRRQLAEELGDEAALEWAIDAAIVLDRPLAGTHLAGLTLPIWTLWELPDGLSTRPLAVDL